MTTRDINQDKFQNEVTEAGKPVLVDFWAPWCGPCRMAGPVLEELSKQYEDKVEIVKVNVDDNTELAQRYGVMSIPTTILFSGDQELGRQVGFAGKGPFEDLIKKGL